MNQESFREETARQIYPIGEVQSSAEGFVLHIAEAFRPGLTALDQFSHIIVLWWAGEHDNPADRSSLLTTLPYAPDVQAGVFACRSPYRPNPIAHTVCPILDLDIDRSQIVVPYIDAFPGSVILDIKPYIPMSDRPREVLVADWFKDWPQWMEDAATFDFDAHGLGEG